MRGDVGADHSTAPFAGSGGPGVGARRRPRHRGQRRLLRAEVEPRQAGARRVHSRQVHARGKWMDGWESRRRRTPGHDWCVVAARHARRDPRRQRRHEPLHRQLSVALLHRRARLAVVRSPRRSLAAEGRAVDAHPSRIAAARRCRTIYWRSTTTGRGRTCGSTSFPTAASRGCASTARSVVDWQARRAARPRRRSGGDPPRRPRARRERHALRRQGQHDHAGPREEHGRRMGNAPAARTRPRLGDRAPRRAGRVDARRDRHEPLQGQLSRERLARRLSRAGRGARCAAATRRGARSCRARTLRPHHRHFLDAASGSAPVSHVRLNIFPDGGVSRLRVHGTVAPAR